MSLFDELSFLSTDDPYRPAYISEVGHLTYRELEQMSANVASYLESKLTHKGFESVALIGHKQPQILAGIVGATRAAVPYIPFDPTTSPFSRIKSLLHQVDALALFPGDEAFLGEWDYSNFQPEPLTSAYILFTSGSTGEPKGVIVPREALEAFVQSTIEVHDLPKYEVWLSVAPWNFDLSVLDTWVGLATGGTIVGVSKAEIDAPARLVSTALNYEIDNWVSTPSFADYCLGIPGFRASKLKPKRLFFCGEVLKPRTARRLFERFPSSKIYNLYGPTEACCAVSSVEITPEMAASDSPLPCGRPYPNMMIMIADASGDAARPGEPGEVILMGPQVATGYLGIVSEKFLVEGDRRAYRTGDRGRMIDGMLYVEGRMDRQVKVHGYRVELGEVESAIRAIGVQDVVVAVSHLGNLVAFIQRPSPSVDQIRSRLKSALPTYMVPSRLELLDQLPLNPNGKIDVSSLLGEHE